MKNWLGTVIVAFCFTANAAPSLQPLRDKDMAHGCGCSFHVPVQKGPSGAVVLQWATGSPANIRLNGKLHKLSVSEPPATSKWPKRVGEKVVYTFKGKEVSGTAHCIATQVCAPGDETCEVVFYKAKITIQTQDGTSLVDAWAECGC